MPKTEGKKKFPWIAVVAAVLVLGAAVGALYFFKYRSETPAKRKINPLNVTVKLKETKTEKALSSKGGDVELAGTVNYKLTISETALAGYEKIKLTEIDSFEGLDEGWEFIAGVQAEPDGAKLSKQATLTISLKDPNEKIIGFRYHADGKDFHFFPVEVKDGTATLTINGFSGYGIINIGDSSPVKYTPTEAEDEATQLLASLVWLENQKTIAGADTGDKFFDNAAGILRDWYKASIRPRLKGAIGNSDSSVDTAITEFLNFMAYAQLFGVEDKLDKEIDEGLDLSAKALKEAAEIARKKCITDKDPEQAAFIMRWWRMAELIPGVAERGANPDAMKEFVKKCVRFKLTMNGEFSAPGYGGGYGVSGVGEAFIQADESLILKGTGVFKEIEPLRFYGRTCSTSQKTSYDVKILDTIISADSQGQRISLPIFTAWSDYTYYNHCFVDDNPADFGTPFLEFQGKFLFHHQDESIEATEEGETYLITDWEILGKGSGVFARKNYSRTKVATTENLTFELIHTPG